MTRALVRCDQCGQEDDHPMVHIAGGRSVHHDCLSSGERAQVVESSDLARQIVEECEGVDGREGLRGDKLRQRILELNEAAQPQDAE